MIAVVPLTGKVRGLGEDGNSDQHRGQQKHDVSHCETSGLTIPFASKSGSKLTEGSGDVKIDNGLCPVRLAATFVTKKSTIGLGRTLDLKGEVYEAHRASPCRG